MNKITDINKFRQKQRFKRLNSHVSKLLIGGAFVAFLAISIYFYEPNELVPTLNVQEPSSRIYPDGEVIVTMNSDISGHYIFLGKINGIPVKFVYDTGATTVAIPEAVANYIGLVKGSELTAKTANGTSLGFRTQLDSVEVGVIKQFMIQGSILSGMDGDEILLGMSFLRNVKSEQDSGILRLIYK